MVYSIGTHTTTVSEGRAVVISHVAQCSLQVKDLDALKSAAAELGLVFMEGQKTHAWYGRWLNDWNDPRAAALQGRDPKTFGTCVHALRLKDHKGGDYEIGVVQNADGTFGLVYDSYGPGRKLEIQAGVDMVKLKAEYGAAVAMKNLKKQLGQGWNIQRTVDQTGYPKVRAVKQ